MVGRQGAVGLLEHDAFFAVVLDTYVDDDDLSGFVLLPQDLLRYRILDQALDGPTERSRSKGRVVADLRQETLRSVGELDPDVLTLELGGNPLDEQVDDRLDLSRLELVEHDDLVDTVQELGPEAALQLLVDPLPHLVVVHLGTPGAEAHRWLPEIPRAEVRRHDDHGVLEV